MRSLLPTTLAILTGLALAGCDSPLLRTPPPSIGAKLSGEQIGAALAGNSLVADEGEVPPLVIYFGAEGDLHGLRANHYRDHGTWRVDDDAVCGEWDNWYGTMSRCWEVYRTERRFTFKRRDGGNVVSATLAVGDIAGLK